MGNRVPCWNSTALEVAARQYIPVTVPDLVGRKLGRYQVISRLGSGGMGKCTWSGTRG